MTCDRCGTVINLGGIIWWQGVRGPKGRFDSSAGNLCDPCHDEWLAERPLGKERSYHPTKRGERTVNDRTDETQDTEESDQESATTEKT